MYVSKKAEYSLCRPYRERGSVDREQAYSQKDPSGLHNDGDRLKLPTFYLTF